jgi:hypothetical protein
MTVILRCRDFEVLYLIINLHNSTISGVSKRTDTKEGIKFRVIMEHEDFFLLVNAQELLLVTTNLSVKQNNPVKHHCTITATEFWPSLVIPLT